MEELGKYMGFKTKSDFYSLTSQDIANYGGSHLINKFYKGSPFLLMQSIFHEEKWVPWKFSQVSHSILLV